MIGQRASGTVAVDHCTVHRHRAIAVPQTAAFQRGRVAVHRSTRDGRATRAGDVHTTAVAGIGTGVVHIQRYVREAGAGTGSVLLDTAPSAHSAIANDRTRGNGE